MEAIVAKDRTRPGMEENRRALRRPLDHYDAHGLGSS